MLQQFPTEILSSVLLYLDFEDLQSARLICNRVSQVAFAIFLKRCFTKIETDFSKRSIKRLEAISSSKEYRNAVLELKFYPWERFGKGLDWPHDSTGKLEDGPNALRIRKLLTVSFPNCTKLGVIADDDEGWPIYQPCNEYLRLIDIVGQIFISMALTQDKITSVAFNLDPRHPEYCLNAVAPSTYESDLFWAAWANLKDFRLDMEADHTDRGLQLAKGLITRAHSLERLALRTCLLKPGRGDTRLYHLLMDAAIVPKLLHLVIEGADFTSAEILVVFLKRFHATLELLSLSAVRLDHGKWRDVCRAMKHQFPKLKRISIKWPQIIGGDGKGLNQLMCQLQTIVPDATKKDYSFVEFHDKGWRKPYGISGVLYAGPDVDSALEFIENSIYSEGSPPSGMEHCIPTPNPDQDRTLLYHGADTEFRDIV